MKRLILLAPLVLVFDHVALGCSIVRTPVSDTPIVVQGKLLSPPPLPAEYVFIGEVVEIVPVAAKRSSDALSTNVEGLKIKVISNIHSVTQAAYYEVVPLQRWPDCVLRGSADLRWSFPIGSKLRIVGKKAVVYASTDSADKLVRVEVGDFDTTIGHNDSPGFESTAESTYDYKTFSAKNPSTDAERQAYQANYTLLPFELQKDLARLVKTKTQKHKIDILERLVYYPYCFSLAFHTLAQAYLKDSEERRTLGAKWDQRKTEQIERSKADR